MSRLRVFIASSIDGFIAGPNDELDWLPSPDSGAEDTYGPFMTEIGALLLGRRTYDVVAAFDGPWPYGDTPVFVATQKPLTSKVPTVHGMSAPIDVLVDQAKRAAGPLDVYLDGGALIRSALDARLVDEVIVTFVPVVLGAGRPLFAGMARRVPLSLEGSRPIGAGMIQNVYRPTA